MQAVSGGWHSQNPGKLEVRKVTSSKPRTSGWRPGVMPNAKMSNQQNRIIFAIKCAEAARSSEPVENENENDISEKNDPIMVFNDTVYA